jgi:hypothetical protein
MVMQPKPNDDWGDHPDRPGYVGPAVAAPSAAVRKPSVHDGLAITSFVLAFFVPLIGLILGWVSIATAHRDGRRASGLAVAGTIIGAVATVAVLIVVIVLAVHATQTLDPAQQLQNCLGDQINGTPLPSYCANVGVNG